MAAVRDGEGIAGVRGADEESDADGGDDTGGGGDADGVVDCAAAVGSDRALLPDEALCGAADGGPASRADSISN